MQPRSVELLETIKRSPKAFTTQDVFEFAQEFARLSSEERASLLQKAKSKTAPRSTSRAPSTAPKLVRGMKADRARDAIAAMLEQERPALFERLTAAEKKTYSAICRALERITSSAAVPTLVQHAIARYSGTTSTDWQNKPT